MRNGILHVVGEVDFNPQPRARASDPEVTAAPRRDVPKTDGRVGRSGKGRASGSSPRFARLRSGKKQLAFAAILRQESRALELLAGLIVAAELGEQITSNAREQVVGAQSGLRDERIDELEPRDWPECHRDCDRGPDNGFWFNGVGHFQPGYYAGTGWVR